MAYAAGEAQPNIQKFFCFFFFKKRRVFLPYINPRRSHSVSCLTGGLALLKPAALPPCGNQSGATNRAHGDG
jgi:hypothetical protein